MDGRMDGLHDICFVTLQSNGLLTYLRFGRIWIIDYNSSCINQQPTVTVIGLDETSDTYQQIQLWRLP